MLCATSEVFCEFPELSNFMYITSCCFSQWYWRSCRRIWWKQAGLVFCTVGWGLLDWLHAAWDHPPVYGYSICDILSFRDQLWPCCPGKDGLDVMNVQVWPRGCNIKLNVHSKICFSLGWTCCYMCFDEHLVFMDCYHLDWIIWSGVNGNVKLPKAGIWFWRLLKNILLSLTLKALVPTSATRVVSTFMIISCSRYKHLVKGLSKDVKLFMVLL